MGIYVANKTEEANLNIFAAIIRTRYYGSCTSPQLHSS